MSTPGTSAWRIENWGRGCDESVMISDYWIPGAGKIRCHKNSIRVWRAVGRIMRAFNYHIRSDVTGCYNCRNITGTKTPSAHSQGIALDTNWDTNPYRLDKVITDMPISMVTAIQSLKNDAGVIAVRWGGDWDGRPETKNSNYDAMHWEIICTPHDVKIGFSIPPFSIADQRMWPLLALNEKGGAVTQLQFYLLQETEIDTDGYFGPKTEAAVKGYQQSRGLTPDGIVSLATWTAMINKQPSIASGAVSPHKNQEIA